MAAVILYPAIDLKDGACVRLKRGAMESATVFNEDPAAQARMFARAGFAWLHCVDLNGAFEGRSVNVHAVRAIRSAVDLPIQLGGGLRDRKTIDAWLDHGIARVVLGTSALRDPALVRESAREWPGCIAVGIDARDGKVAVQGWSEQSGFSALDLARRFEDAGVAAIILTDILRDGVGTGVNVDATAALANAVQIPVIASGGISGVEDIRALRRQPKIAGTVIGRALYDGSLDPAAALAAARD